VHYPHLAKPFAIGTLRLTNRIVMPSLVVFAAEEDRSVTLAIRGHYTESRGAGLVVVEEAVVAPEGRLARTQIGIFEDRHVEGLAGIAEIIHGNSAAVAIQIHHAGRNTTDQCEHLRTSPRGPVARRGREGHGAGRARRGRDRARDPLANSRGDRWGGSLENGARFLREMLARIRAATAGGLIDYTRLGVAEGEAGGLVLADGIQVARWLEQDGVQLLHVTNGIGSVPRIAPEGSPHADRLHLGIEVKRSVGIPVIGVGASECPMRRKRYWPAGSCT